jgi:quinoprotein relay system zinc metallohydrolase 1
VADAVKGIGRRALLASAALAGLTGRAAGAAGGYGLRPVPVAPGLWMFEGRREHFSPENGGNIVNAAVLDTGDGLAVFDTGPSRLYGEEMRRAVEDLGAGPARLVLLSHGHPDHYLGTQAFEGVEVAGLPGTRAMIEALGGAFSDNMYRLIGPWMRGTETVLPGRELAAGPLGVGRRRLELLALSGHTAADLAVFDHDSRTLVTGDLVFWNRAPTTPHADVPAWHASLDRLADLRPARVVPGHGPVAEGVVAIDQTRRYLDWLVGTLADAARRGLDMNEAMRLPVSDEFRGVAVLPEEFVRSVSHLYPALELQVMERVN